MIIATRAAVLALAVALAGAGCKDEHGHSHGTTAPAAAATQPSSTQPAGDHPNRVHLGSQAVRGLQFRATQDEPVKPGGEGAFDLLITGGKPKAVRFWVGVESAEGSVKAAAEEETPDNWHTHVEIPNPLPPGSKFWAEVEPRSATSLRCRSTSRPDAATAHRRSAITHSFRLGSSDGFT